MTSKHENLHLAPSELFDMTGKTVAVTGGSRGLGRAMAHGFARAGAEVIVASRKYGNCETVVAELAEFGAKGSAFRLHVGKWDECNQFVEDVYQRHENVDVFISNAGMSPIAPSTLETSEELFDKVMSVNFKGPFRLMSLFGARMAQANGGSIISVSSMGSENPQPFILPYASAKAALNNATRAFAKEYAGKGVRANVIVPGGFLTDASDAWRDDEELKARVALGRFGEPNEIITTALYLASDYSSYTNGAVIHAFGG